VAVVITAIDPSKGNAGDFVTITGSGFTGARDVSFGANSCGLRYEVIADDTIVCYVPDGTGAVAVKIAGASGPTFTYATTMPAPTVVAITPNAGSSGDTVAITGTGLASTRSVTFDGVVAAFVVASASQLDVLVPAGAGAVTVTVTTPYGSAAKTFTYAALPVPTVSSVAPNKGFPGDPCTITGTGFLTACGVEFDGLAASFMVASDTTIICYVPEDVPAGSRNLIVAGPGGDSAPVAFTVGSIALPRTTAANVQKSAYDGWTSGSVAVTLTADANGGPGVAGTFYQLDNGGITAYSAPFQVSGAGSHHVVWWSVDVRGRLEQPQSGYVNILAASLVPAGLSVVTAGFDAVLAKWNAVASDSPVSYRLYQGTSASGPWTKVADTVANIVSVPQLASAGARYYAAAGVDKNGSESAKSAAFGPISAAAVPVPTVDWNAMPAITETKIADDAISTPKLQANCVTAAEVNVASLQAAVVTAAAVNAVAINAGSITAGTVSTARLDVAAIQAATVTAAAVNALALNASVISAGTIAADHLDVVGLKAQLITATNINALTLNAVNITGGTIKGVVLEGATIRTAASPNKRIEILSDNSIRFYSGDSGEASPAMLLPYVYGVGAGGYLSIQGPKATGQVTGSYISLHGTSTRKDILLAALGGASITIGAAATPTRVDIGGDFYVSGGVSMPGGINTGTAGVLAGGSVIGGITLSGNVVSGASDMQSSRFYTTAACASGTSADGVWINDLTTAARRWKLYMNNGQLYARYDSSGTGYKIIGP